MSSDSPVTAQPPESLAKPTAWLPVGAPGALPDDDSLASWMRDANSLTSRLRMARPQGFRLELLREAVEPMPDDARDLLAGETVWVRRVRMFCDEQLCVCATTLIPHATRANAPWLDALGNRPLGDALLEQDGLHRSPFEFARVSPLHPLFMRALRDTATQSSFLWARRSRCRLVAGPLLIFEIFLPGLGQCGTLYAFDRWRGIFAHNSASMPC